MAFGISGNDTRTFMEGADVVVTWYNRNGPSAIDYYLTPGARQQVYLHMFINAVCVYLSCLCDTVQRWGRSVS